MQIEYFGHSCFRITSENGISVVTDPYTGVGYELPKNLSADIVTVSHGHFDHNYVEGVQGYKTLLNQTGKYLVNGIEFEGILTYHDEQEGKLRGKNIVFKMTIDGKTVCHLGDLGEACSTETVEKIGKVDILLLPIGGTYTIDAKQAFEYVAKIKPKIVIPMHYKPLDGQLDITDAKPFLSLFESVATTEKRGVYTPIFTEETAIVYMERQ